MFENYSEPDGFANSFRNEYNKGICEFLEKLGKEADAKRRKNAENIPSDRETYRKKFINMLGFPLNTEKFPILSVKETAVFENENTVATRLQFEIFENLCFYGILLRHKTDKPLPMVICQHGGGSTAEMTIPFGDDSFNYNDMTARVYNKGVNVFAPQLALWENDRDGDRYDRDAIDVKLKDLGSSVAALEIYSIERVLDYFESQPYCNRRFGMTGLSYGGFYSLYTAAADTRIISTLSTCCFIEKFNYTTFLCSMHFHNGANLFMDAEVGALVCPRYLNIQVGKYDDLFDFHSAEREFKFLKGYYSEAPHMLDFGFIDGGHEFCLKGDDTEIEKFIYHLNND